MHMKKQRTYGKRDAAEIYGRHVDTVFRVCCTHMGSSHDAEDATQTVFFRLIDRDPAFESAEHEKAWLIRVAVNLCYDLLKARESRNVSLEARAEAGLEAAAPGTAGEHASVAEGPDGPKADEKAALLAAVRALDPRLRDVVYLHYYEDYPTAEVARILERPASTVRNQLREARTLLRQSLGGEPR